MNVFVTGATGVLGRTVTRLLLESGHKVWASSRSSDNESRLRALGAEPVRASMFDRPSLRPILANCNAILHLATHVPPANKSGGREAWEENDRIRTEGTRNLVEVALETNVSTFIYPSIAFLYADGGSNWLDDTSRTEPTAPLKSTLYSEVEVERFTRLGRRGIVLRMGSFYGPASSSTTYMVRMGHRGLAMFFGRSKAYYPLIWADDAALAVIDGLAKAPAGIYNIVNDDPL